MLLVGMVGPVGNPCTGLTSQFELLLVLAGKPMAVVGVVLPKT